MVSYDYPTTCAEFQLDIEWKNHDTSCTQTLHVSLFIDVMSSIPLIIFEEHFEQKNDNKCGIVPGHSTQLVYRNYK